jgi:hypothetical protein
VLPFAVLAHGAMFDMVVRDQLLRPQAETSRVARVASIVGVQGLVTGHHYEVVVLSGVVGVLLLAAAAICLTDREARVLVAMLAVNLLVLLASPTYFGHYAELTAAPAAVVVGVALSLLATQHVWQIGRAVAVQPAYIMAAVVIVAALASGVRIATRAEGKPVAGSVLADAAPAGCVASDDPDILIQMNRLSEDLRRGCQVPVDVTGISYDALCRRQTNGHRFERRNNIAWQRYLTTYLTSARAFVVARSAGDGLARVTANRLEAAPRLARAGILTLHAGSGSGARATVQGAVAHSGTASRCR